MYTKGHENNNESDVHLFAAAGHLLPFVATEVQRIKSNTGIPASRGVRPLYRVD
jgi:hypothetical protein